MSNAEYSFNVDDRGKIAAPVSLELDGPEQAHHEAVVAAGEILKDLDGQFKKGIWHMRVSKDDGRTTVSEISIRIDRPDDYPLDLSTARS